MSIKTRRIVIVSKLMLFLVVLFPCFTCLVFAIIPIIREDRNENRIIIKNKSGEMIKEVEITLENQLYKFIDIPDGGQQSSVFSIGPDDHFIIHGKLNDGTVFEGQFGYVTSGMSGEIATFQIGKGGTIDFNQQRHQ